MIVKKAVTESTLKDVYQVRRTVFIEEQGVPASIEIDEREEEAVHFILYEDGIPSGAARLRVVHGAGKAERVCILLSKRGRGLGRHLMKAMEEEAESQGLEFLKLNAQVQAEPFYLQIGYEVISEEPFLDAGIKHVTMQKKL
nr:GNAT family N-acetyltransferase [Alkalicoccus daliensis]